MKEQVFSTQGPSNHSTQIKSHEDLQIKKTFAFNYVREL